MVSHDADERGSQAEGAESAARGLTPLLFGVITLPGGAAQGFITVSLSYLLRQHGVSVASIAALASLMLLPQTWRFVFGPVIDVSLTPKRWFLICTGAGIVCFTVMGFMPLTPAGMPPLGPLALGVGVATAASSAAGSAIIARTVPVARRGAVAGWIQTGNLGGAGLGGGLGLWLCVHAGGPVPAGPSRRV